MRLSERARDFVVVGAFLAVVGGLVTVGWVNREPDPGVGTGEMAPSLRLPTLDGDTASLAALRGRVVLLNIWATWCAPCVREMPALQRVYERYRDRGLEVLAVSTDAAPGTRRPDGSVVGLVSEFVDRFGLTFPVALDPSAEVEGRFGTEWLPTTVLIDREGRIRFLEIGAREWDEEPWIGEIESLLKEG